MIECCWHGSEQLNITCVRCGTENPARFSFCGGCGAPLQAPAPQALERRHLVVLMCDLVGSTQHAEHLDPEDYATLLQTYHARIRDIVAEWGGHTAQYLGDGVLVYFGFPQASEDDAQRAIHAGLSMIQAAQQLTTTPPSAHAQTLQVRVGIHTGEVVAADIGDTQRRDRLALGSTPNIAARVQSLAAPGQLLITQPAYDAVRRQVAVEPLGQHALKGVAESMPIYQAVAINAHANLSPPQGKLVGRQQELRRLLQLVGQRRGNVVLVSGEAGIGKSRLIAEMYAATSERELRIAKCYAYQANTDFYPLAETIRQEVRWPAGASIHEQTTALQTWATAMGLPAIHLGPLNRVLGGVLPAGQAAPHRSEVIAALCAAICAHNKPLGLVVEDWHWIDPSSRECIANIIAQLSALQGPPVHVVITSRTQHLDLHTQHHSILLERLGQNEVNELLQNIRQVTFPAEAVAQITARSEGVPFYVEELTRTVEERLRLAHPDGIEKLVPDSIHSALHARLDALGPAKEAAQIAALAGRTFSYDLLAAVTAKVQAKGLDLDAQLQELVQSGTVYRTVEGRHVRFKFRHSLVQDTAYNSLLKSQRIGLHRHLADVLIQQPELAPGDLFEHMARHHEGAEEFAAAMHAYQQAGDGARRRAAYVEACHSYHQALKMLQQCPDASALIEQESQILRALVTAMTARGGYGDAETRPLLDRITELGERQLTPKARFGTRMSEWGFHAMAGHRNETFYFAQLLAEFTRSDQPPMLAAAANYALGSTHFYAGDHTVSSTYMEQAIQLMADGNFGQHAKDLVQPAFLAFITHGLQATLCGQVQRGRELLHHAVDLATQRDVPFARVQSLIHRSFVLRELEDDPAQRIPHLRTALQLAEEHNMERWALAAGRMLAWDQLATGETSLVGECASHFQPEHENTVVTLAYDAAANAEVLLNMDALDRAVPIIQRAAEFAETRLSDFARPAVLRAQGKLAAQMGRHQEAQEYFEQGINVAASNGAKLLELKLHLACLEHLPGLAARRPQHVQRAAELLEICGLGVGEPLGRRALATLG